MNIEGYEIHELAQKIPEMTAQEYRQLKESIHQIGQTAPIIRHKGKILDGRTRLKACLELGIEPKIEEYKGQQTIAQFIFSTNIRRNLTKLQRQQMIADFAPIIYPEVEAEAKESQKSKPGVPSGTRSRGRTRSVRTKLPARNGQAGHPARIAFMEKTGANVNEARMAKVILDKAPELLPEVSKLGGLSKTAAEAKRRSAAKQPTGKPAVTQQELQKRREAILNGMKPLPSLTREQVDPDFKGSPQDFIDKYGHVQLRTKEQIEQENDKVAFSAWVGVFRALKTPLNEYLKVGKFRVENYHHFIAKAPNKERRIGEMKELLDMAIRFRESLDWLVEELGKK